MNVITVATQKTMRETYIDARKKIGTQSEVAAMLEVTRQCIQRRESGKSRVTREAMLAMLQLAGKTATAVPVKKEQVANAPAPNWYDVPEEKFDAQKTKHRPPRSLFQDQNNFYKLVREVVALGPEFDAFMHAEFVRVEFIDFSDVGRVVFKIKDPEAMQKLIDDAEEKTIPIVERFFRECEFLVAEV